MAIEKDTNQTIVIGCMDHTMDNTFESANRVYGKNGIAPALSTCAGGGLQPKVIAIKKRGVSR